MNPLLLTDYYKTEHNRMYPEGTTMIYSNFTPRKSRNPEIKKVVFFGLQHFILEYLIKKFNEDFFADKFDKHNVSYDPSTDKYIRTSELKKKKLIEEYKRHIPVDTKHIEDLYDLGYLPIEIKALPEGALVPIGVPCFVIYNTHPNFGWLTNYLESLISAMMWQPITSATISYEYKKLLTKHAIETTGSPDFVQWQGHDFSMRGMSSVESAILSGMGHLLNFTGTDTIPAIYQLEKSYFADGLIGASVPATEHSVMCMGGLEDEIETFRRLLKLYPKGILSVVSDTWDLWKVCTEYLPVLKDEILARDGKLVIRPDSGDPVDIVCGIDYTTSMVEAFSKNKGWFDGKSSVWKIEASYDEISGNYHNYVPSELISDNLSEIKGVIELLWDLFGGTMSNQGFKMLDPHIGAIYGDSINLVRAKQICERLRAKGFASTNIVLGIGSFTYQYNTRDTFGFAMKATYGEVVKDGKVERKEIWKDPVTDDGTKKSAKGLLRVNKSFDPREGYTLTDQCDWDAANEMGELKTVFKNGELVTKTTLAEIRERLKYEYTPTPE